MSDTGLDADCEEADCDGDGHLAVRAGGDDCDDTDPDASPDAVEVCDNLVDDDCDGRTDAGCEVAGPPDPGGLAWICGVGSFPIGPVVLAVVALGIGRRR